MSSETSLPHDPLRVKLPLDKELVLKVIPMPAEIGRAHV